MITYHYKEIHKQRVSFLQQCRISVADARGRASNAAKWGEVNRLRLLEVRIIRLLHKACISIEGLEKP